MNFWAAPDGNSVIVSDYTYETMFYVKAPNPYIMKI